MSSALVSAIHEKEIPMKVNTSWSVGLAMIVASMAAGLTGCSPEATRSEKAAPRGSVEGRTAARTAAGADASIAGKSNADAKVAAEKSVAPSASLLPKIPVGLQDAKLMIASDDAVTPEKIELGKRLYFDPRLSKDGTISCATCHNPKEGWAEHEPTSTGIKKQVGARNAPTIINAAYAKAQFWDGRAATLEEQALGPIANPVEMGHDIPAMIQDLSKVREYKELFRKAFGSEEVTKEGVAKAIAAFERTILSGNSPYDRYQAGDKLALNAAQKRGMELFEANCAACHSAPLFSNYQYYNAGVGGDKHEPDPGRKKVTGKDSDLGKFRVPSLRNVAETWPYFHDGSAAKLEDAVALMAAGGKDNPNLSSILKGVREAKLTADNCKDLVEFLKSLSGEVPQVELPKL
jgi:cytochrome c peroxidase